MIYHILAFTIRWLIKKWLVNPYRIELFWLDKLSFKCPLNVTYDYPYIIFELYQHCLNMNIQENQIQNCKMLLTLLM